MSSSSNDEDLIEVDLIVEHYSLEGPMVGLFVVSGDEGDFIIVVDEELWEEGAQTFGAALDLVKSKRPEMFSLDSGFSCNIECHDYMIPELLARFEVDSEAGESDPRIAELFGPEFIAANGVLCDRDICINGAAYAPLSSGKIVGVPEQAQRW